MFLIITGCLAFLAGLYFLRIALLGRNPNNLSTAVGTLVKASGYKNVPMKYGGVIKNQTDYAYAYTVNGKTYRRSGRINAHKRTLPRKAEIVYVTGHPRSGYIGKFSGINQWLYAISCFVCGVYLIWISFL